MTTEEAIRMKELYDALDWIVTHLDHRPGLRQAVNLITSCERDSLRRVRDAASTEIARPCGYDAWATGYEVALIGRLPVDRVSSEVESYIYAMRGQIEEQAKRIKELEAAPAGKLLQAVNLLREAKREINHLESSDDHEDEEGLYFELRDWLEAFDGKVAPAQKKLTQHEQDLIAMMSHVCEELDSYDLPRNITRLIEEMHELCDNIDPSEKTELLPFDGETPFGIELDGGCGDEL